MQISPRYDGEPFVVLDGEPSAIGEPMLRQRRRLLRLLATLGEDQWAVASRCEGWTVRDVAEHLVGVDGFWTLSLLSGLNGDPTRILASFDPKATPAAMVESSRGKSATQTLADLTAATTALCDAVEALSQEEFEHRAEAPPGHVTISTMLHHALWDCWVHERDILVPLGIEASVEPDELAACLRYAAALGPALAAQRSARQGALELVVTDPDLTVSVAIGDQISVTDGPGPADAPRITGSALQVLEALSIRAPFPSPVSPADAWLVGGLAAAFE